MSLPQKRLKRIGGWPRYALILRYFFLNSLKKNKHLSVHLDMNLFKAIIHPFICWTPFKFEGEFMFTKIWILFELASIPQAEMRYPKNFLELTLNTHFFGISFYDSLSLQIFCWRLIHGLRTTLSLSSC